MRFYLGTPGSALHAHLAQNCPVLISYGAAHSKHWLVRDYASTFSHLLLDSGAFSELNTGVSIDLGEYVEWTKQMPWAPHAGLDDISGDWRRSLRNYEADPDGFPSFHDTDPPELLDDLIPMARERGGWLGIGLKPPRQGKRDFVARTLERMPDDLHIHGWALGMYADLELDSIDSTNWFRDVKYLRDDPMTAHLTPAECLEIIVKRYKRANRKTSSPSTQLEIL